MASLEKLLASTGIESGDMQSSANGAYLTRGGILVEMRRQQVRDLGSALGSTELGQIARELNVGLNGVVRSLSDDELDSAWDDAYFERQDYLVRIIVTIGAIIAALSGALWGLSKLVWVGEAWTSASGRWLEKLASLFSNLKTFFLSPGGADRWLTLIAVVLVSIVLGRVIVTGLKNIPITRRQWQNAIQTTLVPLIRVGLNRRTDVANQPELYVKKAPGLGEVRDPQHLVVRDELRTIKALLDDLGAPALAVSGPRGVGKTTLLKTLSSTDSEGDGAIKFMVSAPVSYNPQEFLVLLYARLCEKVLAASPPPKRSLVARLARGMSPLIGLFRKVVRLGLTVVIAYSWLTLFIAEASNRARSYGLPVPTSVWTAITMTVIYFFLFWLTGKLYIFEFSKFPPAITARADDDLRRLRFLQTVSSEYAGGLKGSGFELGRRLSKQLAERPTTLPELVERYRSFAEAVANWCHAQTGTGVLICIDEVDRISTAEAAEAFLNEIKAIFGVPHCRYVVSVSEDALTGFERRVIGVRPALDSAFDEVLRLDVLSVQQSIDLLQRHVVGFPKAFIALCHCLAGGLPRDLVRAARTLIDARTESDMAALSDLTPIVVDKEIAALKRGLAGALSQLDPTDAVARVLQHVVAADWPDFSGGLQTVNELLSIDVQAEPAAAKLKRDSAAALYFYLTVADVFSGQYSVEWDDVCKDKRGAESSIAQRLASIRGLLQLSPDLTISELNDVRTDFALPALDSSSRSST